MIVLLLGGLDLGWHLGHSQQQQPLGEANITPSGISSIFTYNRTFAEVPSDESNAAWETLFPTRGGFFKHPQLAPDRSGLAVFHQLHCLDNIRKGYWAAVHGKEDHHVSPAHVRHCIDYLRQSLICHADTNVEPVIEDLHGVRGFGVEHKCRDFSRVKDWIAEWEDGVM
ncbi:hypothetical protein PISL3812_09173 [Talaromyces islandicus]|uniref:Oxidase ustYa n=1 Tax=Talaromyces islandicus TaxID=28573 RepID=A0A0U1M980_TALIS|nr:hypothetical protein PISL3812_09173 [Talaromyces islandicus]